MMARRLGVAREVGSRGGWRRRRAARCEEEASGDGWIFRGFLLINSLLTLRSLVKRLIARMVSVSLVPV